ncbi:hypothetical protein HDV05_005317 [Chytridiales sp. JEL 0842]|nr:hypothetical protein HDV05_005317 [Chytridiales sp. JEL 0842]
MDPLKSMIKDAIDQLRGLSTGELADAMTRLGITSYVRDSRVLSPASHSSVYADTYFIGPAHTVEFVPVTDTLTPAASCHHVDTLTEGSVMVIASPCATTYPNALWGGLMTARAKKTGAVAAVIDGRVRDLKEIWDMGFTVVATQGTSVLGAGGYLRPCKVGEPVVMSAGTSWPVLVKEGDIMVGDVDGTVRVPLDRALEVAQVAKSIREVDGRCMDDILNGVTIALAFKTHRGKK